MFKIQTGLVVYLLIALCLVFRSGMASPDSANSRRDLRDLEAQATSTGPSAPLETNIIIDSIEEEQSAPVVGVKPAVGTSSSSLSNRHRYDQQSQTVAIDQDKLEARNQVESGDSDQQQSEQMIIDHRPSSIEAGESSTSSPFGSSTSTPSSTSTVGTSTTSTSTTTPSSLINQQVSYQAWPVNNNNGQGAYTHSGQMMGSSSNQVMSVQHPTSINSIINDQQQQQQQQQQQVQQPQMVSINGQPVLLMPSGSSPLPQVAANGQQARRISISGWLRGLSSMLANIFNRRDHANQLQVVNGLHQVGAASAPSGQFIAAPAGMNLPMPVSSTQAQTQNQQQPQSSSTATSSGGWLQLGPNAPHWLTQAQSAIQQLQQQAASSTNRYTTFIQAPSSLISSAQQQPQMAPATTTYAIALPPTQPAQVNYQQVASPPGDLQASSSSSSFVTAIQAPQQFQTHLIAQPQVAGNKQSGSSSNHQPLFGRSYSTSTSTSSSSSSSLSTPQNKQATSTTTTNPVGSQQQVSYSMSTANNNLPLAHYSQHK